MISALVRDDGYTITTFIKEQDHMYPSVLFERRPTTLEMRAGFVDWTRGADTGKQMNEKESARAAAKTMAKRIVSWDVVDPKGNPVPVSEATLMQIHPDLFIRMRNIICLCIDGGDERPSDTSGDRLSDGAGFLSSLDAEYAPGEALGDEQKNSEMA